MEDGGPSHGHPLTETGVSEFGAGGCSALHICSKNRPLKFTSSSWMEINTCLQV